MVRAVVVFALLLPSCCMFDGFGEALGRAIVESYYEALSRGSRGEVADLEVGPSELGYFLHVPTVGPQRHYLVLGNLTIVYATVEFEWGSRNTPIAGYKGPPCALPDLDDVGHFPGIARVSIWAEDSRDLQVHFESPSLDVMKQSHDPWPRSMVQQEGDAWFVVAEPLTVHISDSTGNHAFATLDPKPGQTHRYIVRGTELVSID